ncbi:sensor histidine kinase [Oceaniglobus ichthyenteri]|uniref:sensor histidine kinase n=1 Tax=Oceaniglobus ichthyenteri TaxID=2136177 RepID=UPI00197FCA2A|nr:ATP-binding protein [Oceaniglobus ichthyenteri]
MRRYFAPGSYFAVVVISSLLLVLWLIWLATEQPWLGLKLGVGADGDVVIEQVSHAADVPQDITGARLVSLARSVNAGSEPGTRVILEPRDLIEEPDSIGSAEELQRFFARQDQLVEMLRGGPVELEIERDGGRAQVTVGPAPTRMIAEIPVQFWLQVFVALSGLVIGAWVVCLRPRDAAAWMFLIAGLGLAMSSGAAALYSTRELALSGPIFTTASRINSSGALIFGIGMVSLFLIYPRQIVPRAALWIAPLGIGGILAFVQLADWPRHLGLVPNAIAAVMAVLLVAIIAQVVVNRHDPRARAMLGWLGLSIAVGAGGFVLTSVVPTLLGYSAIIEQSTAFLFFLLIHVGVAMGVLRYRLFDLATWSFGIVFYGLGVALLLVLDAALIYGLSLDRAPALGVALAMVGVVYLPLREAAARLLRHNRRLPAEVLYERITEIAQAMPPTRQQALLQAFWTDLFKPLKITALKGDDPVQTTLVGDGASLILAPIAGLTALRLEWAYQGSRLFSSADLIRAKTLNSMIARSLQQHRDYAEAIADERLRINRDMHDNIGVLLLSALHASTSDRKDLLIRQTLADLREIISNPDQTGLPLPQLIADMRAEIIGHLEAAEIDAHWHDHALPDLFLTPQIMHTLRCFLREATSNIVRHSGASTVHINVSASADGIAVSLCDDGRGFEAANVQSGNGFKNLAARVAQLHGTFDLQSTPEGTRISASLPLEHPMQDATPNENIYDTRAAE